MAKEKKQLTTLQHLRRWKAANAAIRSGMYLFPAIPTGIITGLNANEWFGENAKDGWSIGLGFAMLLSTFLASILTVANKDKVIKEKTSGFMYIGILFCAIGISLVMLASILSTLGWYFFFVGISLFGSLGCAIASDKWSGKWVGFYSGLAEEHGLSSPAEKRKKARMKAAEEEASREVDLT